MVLKNFFFLKKKIRGIKRIWKIDVAELRRIIKLKKKSE